MDEYQFRYRATACSSVSSIWKGHGRVPQSSAVTASRVDIYFALNYKLLQWRQCSIAQIDEVCCSKAMKISQDFEGAGNRLLFRHRSGYPTYFMSDKPLHAVTTWSASFEKINHELSDNDYCIYSKFSSVNWRWTNPKNFSCWNHCNHATLLL